MKWVCGGVSRTEGNPGAGLHGAVGGLQGMEGPWGKDMKLGKV